MHRRDTSDKGDQERMDDRTGSSDPQPPQLVTFDAILPQAMALRAEETGVKRINTDPMTRFVLSVLAGAFIAFGAIFATTVMAGNGLPYGVVRLLGGLVFSLGLILVVIDARSCSPATT
jgi:formate transporter